MSRSIQNICGILGSYKDGKLFEGRKGRSGRKSLARDEIDISDEARRRLRSQEDNGDMHDTDDAITNEAGDLLNEMHGSYEI